MPRSRRIFRPLACAGLFAAGASLLLTSLRGASPAKPSAAPGTLDAAQPAAEHRFATASTTRPAAAKVAAPPRPKLAPSNGPQERAPLPPLAAAPRALAGNSGALVNAPVRDWLPPAAGPHAPRPLASDVHHAQRAPRAADVPALAMDLASDPPERLRLPAGPPVSTASIDAEALFVRPPQSRAERHADTSRDPASAQSTAAALAAMPPLRQTPGPAVKLAIPDPDGATDAVHVRESAPDTDAPVTLLELPPRPPLPVAQK